ncbi:eCIS core domain-containing protein [Streptomyces yunnanensis]|uniref:eCIS core domain-containing protein n=1 Tax=Streptomyces yunnanensis TaxID=156453 RepID=A0A9X8QV30_9ACTN|nr:DUF4157 domain-containing protein [Streptomyces yunnanensis]SHM34545.1 protein of unknown function [Streptomyces yunnanensis]
MSSSSQSAAQSGQSARDARRRRRKERSARSAAPEPKNIVSGAGQPLDLSVRRELEEQLGHDFSRVRLHTDRDSGQLAELMGADAFAVGQDIFFREGTYRPGTADGQRLLAHELLHTVQNPHGLGALRAGRDLGTVSLPQEAVEREAESAAQESLRSAMLGATREDDPATEVAPGRSTPGWLRYATVDADRHRLELIDPATLVDRLANGVLRSLRGDPEDRSGRVRVQLARMAPELQDSVLERLEVRLLSSEHDRLLDLVEEVERGPLPFMTSTVPEPVTDEAAALEQERTQDTAAARDRSRQEEKAGDDRRKRAQHRKDADPAGNGGPERGRSTAGGSANASASEAGTGQAAVRSAAADDKAAAGARRTEQEQARQDDTQATEHAAEQDRANSTRGPEEQAAGGPGQQTAGQQVADAGGEHPTGPGGEQVTAPEAPDNSAAEPGEKDPRGRDQDESSTRAAGDPENEEDADDEPLGLEDEAADTDADAAEADAQDDQEDGESTEAEADDAGAGDASDSPEADQSDADLTGPGDAAARRTGQREPADRNRGDAPGVISSPATEDQSAVGWSETRDEAEATDDGASSPEEEQESDDQLSEDLQADKSTEQEVGPDPDEKAEDDVGEDPGSQDGDPGDPDDAELEREQAAERTEDAEAKRRDDAARTATDGTGGTDVPGGGTAQPEKLSKADEDARKQATAASSSGSATASASGGRTGGEGSAGAQAQPSGTADGVSGSPAPTSGSGSPPASAAQDGTRQDQTANDAASKPAERSPGDTTSPEAARSGDGSTGIGVAQTESATQGMDVTAGRGPATTPDPSPDSGQVAAAGPTVAPKPSPTAGAGGGGGAVPPQAQGGAVAEPSAKPARGTPPAVRSGATPRQRQVSRQAAKNVRRGGGGGGTRTASTPARGVRGGGGGGSSAPAKAKKDAAPPDVTQGTPEAGLATVAKLKPYQMLETFKGVNSAVGNSVGKERTSLRNAPPQMERPIGSPRTVPGGPKPAAPGTYSNEKVARTDAAKGKTDEITGEQRPEGKAPGSDVPEPSWWDILLTIGGALLKRIFPFDDLIDSIMGLPHTDDGLKGARVGNAPGLPLRDDSDPQRTDEQSQKLDERKGELHQSGREDAARPMGEDQIFPDAPRETLTGKVPGGAKQTGQQGGAPATATGSVPVESASAVAEHDRGPQIQTGFSQGLQRMGKERRAKDDKARADKEKHDRDLKREVDTSTKKQAGEREKGQQDIADTRDKWRKEQDDKVAEIDDKKGKKFEKVRKDVDDKQEQTDKDVDKRTEDDNQKIDDEHTNAENDAQQEQDDKKKEAEKGDGGFLDQLKQWWQDLKDKIKQFFERARKAVTDLIDKFKREVFKLIDDARNWVVQQINDFADALIAFGDEMLADYPAMRDKWRNTINAGRNYAVQKVNEAADKLKDVAGSLLDGLGGALLAGLDVMEDGLLKAVDVAENVTVSAVEFGQQAIAALGEWAAIFSDIVSDPGDWISKAGTAAETGAKEHLFDEIKSAVKEWFNQKVQEITGLSPQEFQELLDGNVSVQEMGQMAWDAAVPQLPMIIGTLVIEKVVAKLIPGVGWVMGIIDALKTAWGTLSRILAAFGLVMDFLKAVKSGNGAVPFAKAVAAGVVALLELVYQALIDGISRFMGGVTKKLGGILKNLRTKRRPGGHGEPGAPGAPGGANRPGRPGHEPGAEPHTTPTGRTTDPHHNEKPGEPGPATDKPGQRPAPRKPSPDKTSHPEPGPSPAKRPSPEKKPHPKDQPQPKSKKKPDAHERREDGREVNDARRRLRNAKNKQRNDSTRPSGPKHRGPARDTLRPKGRPGTKRRPSEDPLKKHHPTTKPKSKPKGGHRKPATKPKRRPSRARRALNRARHTVKSALARARRAARRLFGKARHLGHRLQHHAHRLRNRWRHHRDRLRNRHHRRQDSKREPHQNPDGKKDYDLPKVRFRTKAGEMHTLLFDGRGKAAKLGVHSHLEPLNAYLREWRDDNAKLKETDPARYTQQEQALKKAEGEGVIVNAIHHRMPDKETAHPRRGTRYGTPIYTGRAGDANFERHMSELQQSMETLADLLAQRVSESNEPPLPATILPPFSDGPVAKSFKASYIKESTPRGTEAGERPESWPLGWDRIVAGNHAKNAAWVRMHMLTAQLGGHTTTSNLVPATREDNNDAREGAEHPAALSLGRNGIGKKKPASPGADDHNKMIWYDVDITLRANYPGFPSSVQMRWGGYHHRNGPWERESAPGRSGAWTTGTFGPPPWAATGPTAQLRANVNHDDANTIRAVTRIELRDAKRIVAMRGKEPGGRFSGLDRLKQALTEGNLSTRTVLARQAVIAKLDAAASRLGF